MSTTTTTFTVVGMTCGHCVSAVTAEIAKIADVDGVDIDLESGSVSVRSSGDIDPRALAAAVDEAGYELG